MLNADEKDALLNSFIGASKTTSVLVCLIHNEKEYLIERKEIFTLKEYSKIDKEQSFKIYITESFGNTMLQDSKDYDSIITSILPENLSDYFFFWGERIEKLSEKKELSGAVKQFLGLDTMDETIRHLTSVVNKLTREAGTGANDAEIEKLEKRIIELEKRNEDLDIQISSCQKNVDYNRNKSNDLYEELTTSENRELQTKQTDLKNKCELLEYKKKELNLARDNFNKHFNDSKNYVYFFANTAEKKAVDLLKRNPEPVIGWNYIDMNAVNEIIQRGKCICGNVFCEGDTTYTYLTEQRKLVAPNVIGGVINSFVEEIERRDVFNQNYYDLIHSDYKRISELQDEICDIESDVEILRKNIMGKADMKEKSKRYQEFLSKIEEYNRKLGQCNAEKERNNEDINRCNNNIRVYMERNKKYYRKLKTINCAQRILDLFKEDYYQNERTLKTKLENHVNKNFEDVYSGDRIIKIDEKYNAVAYNKVGDNWITSETSPGLETVKNFAFISGLVQCAKEKIIGANGSETEANCNSYPLVLDAPFSQADEKHIPAISKLISKNAEQIILVVMKKDWNYAKNVLSSKVGKSYNLEKISETQTKVKEGE